MQPILQIALDFINLDQALRVAAEAVEGGADWLEAGTPLIKSEGLEAVRRLKKEFPGKEIVADMKVMDAGRFEVEAAAKAGADIVDVLACASNATITECIETARHFGVQIAVDMIGVPDIAARAREIAALGPDYLVVHTSIDDQMKGGSPFENLEQIAGTVGIPVGVAGGINSETCVHALKHGAGVVIVGGAVTKSSDAREAVADIRRAMVSGEALESKFYKRADLSGLREAFLRVSTCNVSDAMHRAREMEGITPMVPGVRMAGPAFTVRTAPGDWSRPVAAVDEAAEGDVLVVDAGGVPPAVWGELATNTARNKKLAGVVVEGAVRDSGGIRELGFPVFSRCCVPAAGEPKGFGETGVTVIAGHRTIAPGDWIVGDENGVIAVPRASALEIANRAADVLERENRIRSEITGGNTLSSVMELLKWEKQT